MRLYNRIPVRDYDVWALKRAGYTGEELSREWGVSESAVHMAARRHRAKLVRGGKLRHANAQGEG